MPGTLTFFASATAIGPGVTAPANIQAGDILVLTDSVSGTIAAPATVVATGFTSISNIVGTGVGSRTRTIQSAKLANGTEGSTVITAMDGNASARKLLLVFRPSKAAASFAAQDVAADASDGALAAQTVNASNGTVPLLVIAHYNGNGGFTREFAPAKDAEITVTDGTISYLAYKIYNSSPQDTVVSIADTGDINVLVSYYLNVSVPPPVALDVEIMG